MVHRRPSHCSVGGRRGDPVGISVGSPAATAVGSASGRGVAGRGVPEACQGGGGERLGGAPAAPLGRLHRQRREAGAHPPIRVRAVPRDPPLPPLPSERPRNGAFLMRHLPREGLPLHRMPHGPLRPEGGPVGGAWQAPGVPGFPLELEGRVVDVQRRPRPWDFGKLEVAQGEREGVEGGAVELERGGGCRRGFWLHHWHLRRLARCPAWGCSLLATVPCPSCHLLL